MRSSALRLRRLAVFAMLAAVTLVSQIALMAVPGVQLVGVFIASFTLAYGVKALIPIYVYVLLYCVFFGFSIQCLPYLYVWLVLFGMFMLAGKINVRIKAPLYMLFCGLFGLSFGTLCAPAQALIFGLNFKMSVAWIIAGFPIDITHALNNFVLGALILPLSELLKKLEKDGYGVR